MLCSIPHRYIFQPYPYPLGIGCCALLREAYACLLAVWPADYGMRAVKSVITAAGEVLPYQAVTAVSSMTTSRVFPAAALTGSRLAAIAVLLVIAPPPTN